MALRGLPPHIALNTVSSRGKKNPLSPAPASPPRSIARETVFHARPDWPMAPLSNSVKVTVAFHLRDLNGVPVWEARNCLNQPASALTVHISSRERLSPVRHTKPSFEPAQGTVETLLPWLAWPSYAKCFS